MNSWTSEEINALKLMYQFSSKQELCDALPHRTWVAIKHMGRKLGLFQLSQATSNGKLENLLTKSLISMYWIGFLLADGSFPKNGTTLSLTLSITDFDHLKTFAKFMQAPDGAVKVYTKATNMSDSITFCQYVVGGKYYCEKIRDTFGIPLRKTYNPPDILILDALSDDELLALFIGYIDGDGSINNQKKINIECDKSWRPVLELFKRRLETMSHISTDAQIRETKNNGSTYIKYGLYKIDLIQFLVKFITINTLPVLSRKWNKLV